MTRAFISYCKACALLWLCIPVAIAAAEVLDPTRPPDAITAPQGTAVQISNSLQTIIISPRRRAAIIDGQTVELGAKHGDVRLIEVSEGSVVLEGSQGRQVLSLFPGVAIRQKADSPPVKPMVKPAARKARPPVEANGSAAKKEEK
jgi:MSHA biogenesis protein MshK